jgi:hypothetical protein
MGLGEHLAEGCPEHELHRHVAPVAERLQQPVFARWQVECQRNSFALHVPSGLAFGDVHGPPLSGWEAPQSAISPATTAGLHPTGCGCAGGPGVSAAGACAPRSATLGR